MLVWVWRGWGQAGGVGASAPPPPALRGILVWLSSLTSASPCQPSKAAVVGSGGAKPPPCRPSPYCPRPKQAHLEDRGGFGPHHSLMLAGSADSPSSSKPFFCLACLYQGGGKVGGVQAAARCACSGLWGWG